MAQRNEIFTRKVIAGSRTYFLDVKLNSRNDRYLVVTESRRNDSGSYDHHRVMIFEENLTSFYEGLGEVLKFLNATDKMPAMQKEMG